MPALTIIAAPSTGPGNPQQGVQTSVTIDENIGDNTLIGFVRINPALTYSWDVQGTTTLNWNGCYSFEQVVNPEGLPAGTYLRIFVTPGKGGEVNFNREVQDFGHDIGIVGKDANNNRVDVGSFEVTMRNVNEDPTKLGLTTFGGVNGGDTTPVGQEKVEHSVAGTIIGQLGSEDADGLADAATHKYTFVGGSNNGTVSSDGVFRIEQFTNQFNQIKYRVVINDASLYDYDSLPEGAKYFEHTIRVTDAGGKFLDRTFRIVPSNDPGDDVSPPTITGAPATVGAESTGANVAPFNTRLAINYANNTDQLTVEVSFPAANGVFQGQTAGGDATTKVYTFTGTRDQVNTWLASLQFNPDDKFSGAATDTTFTVKVKPQAATTWSATNTNIHVTADINDNATGTIPGSDVAATVGTAMNPFAGITVTDEENDTVTLTITFAPGGTWTGLTSTGLVTVVNQSATGSITFTGKAGDVSNFLDGVGYTPASAGAKAFTVKVVDAFTGAGQHTETTVGSFNVTATAATADPTITGAPATVGAESTGANVAPFNTRLAINYANNTDQLTVEVSFPAANGVFQGQTAGGDATTKVYTFTGTRDQVNTWLASLQFNPDDKFSGAATDTTFTVKVKPQAATTWSATNTNIHVTADINDNATGTIPGSDVAATVGTAMNPFAGITVTDEENDTVTLTITFAPGGTWTGLTSTGLVTVVNQSATGSITFTGKAGDVSNFLDGVGYTPASAGAKAFTVKVVDAFTGAGQHTETTVGSFNVTATAVPNVPPTISDPTAVGAGTLGTGADAGKVFFDENVGTVQIFDVNATDTDGGIMTYSVSGVYPAGAFSIDGNGTVSVDTSKLGNITTNTPFTVKVTADDGQGGSTTRDVIVVVRDVPPPLNEKPTITVNGGTQVIGATANGPAVKAFYDIQVHDAENDSLTLTISFASGDGVLRDQNNQLIAAKTDDAVTKTYEFTGNWNTLNGILDELKFDARDRADGGVVNTNFTVKVWDIDHQNAPAVNTQITVSTALTNRAPTIHLDGPQTFHVNDINDSVLAFGGFDLDDIERDNLTVTIKFDEDDGDLVGVNIPDPVLQSGQKVYTFANRTAGELELILDNLRFNATDRPNQNSGTIETTFTVEVSDGDKTATNTQLKVVTDIVNKQPPVVNKAPTDLKLNGTNGVSVQEYTLVGTEIGTLSAIDANGDALTYTLLDNAGGRFAIDGNKLKLAGAGVNFEEAASHQIKVQVSDGKGGVTEQVFTVGVTDQLTLNKRGSKKSDKLNGSTLDDILKGGSGNVKDTIKGLAGDDKLYGEGGNDSILGGDGIDSLYGGAGNDTLKGEAGKDLLKGDAGNDKVYGGLGDDMLYGGAGNDILKGDADNDVLFGEAGNDKLYGGAGNDIFVFNKKASKAANFDRIYDFKSGQDKLFLDNAVFKKLGALGTFDVPAKLDATMFATGRAKDRNDHLVYKSGILYYDADGSGKGAAVEIVKLSGLKVTDIFVI